MKAIVFIAGMAVFGGIAGAGYSEYSRIQTAERNAHYFALEMGKTYAQDANKALAAARQGVKACAARDYNVEFPPVMTDMVAEMMAADYELVKKYGIGAKHHTDKAIDLRNKVANSYYDAIDRELETLPAEVTRRVLEMMRTFRVDRTTVTRCVNEQAFIAISNMPVQTGG